MVTVCVWGTGNIGRLAIRTGAVVWDRMSAHYTDAEIVELSMCLGSWLAFGRLNHVLGLDTACVLPSRR